MVEAISMFRMRYVVEAKEESHALDEIAMQGENLHEFSQKHIDEIIISSREVSKAEVLKQFDIDNDYAASWSKELKMKNTINKIDYTK